MNILPKKRWHVRTKENIARVNADKAKFADEQEKKNLKALIAEQEARVNILRKRGDTQLASSSQFSLTRDHALNLEQGNKEYEAEKKAEQEKKEKAIGLLTYLGQSVLDSHGEKPWYDVHPKKRKLLERDQQKAKEELESKKKSRADPLTEMKKIEEVFQRRKELKAQEASRELQRANACIKAMPTLFPDDILVPKSNPIKNSQPVSTEDNQNGCNTLSKSVNISNEVESTSKTTDPNPETLTSDAIKLAKKAELDRLRAERLQRERKERERAAVVMAKAMGLTAALSDPKVEVVTDERKLPFNSAFNPELASVLAERRQRYRESRKRRYDDN